ncbi:hypothetical protein KM043_018591 [Ampulex compressa]|nr:hypothetical protein KM043_018591 [Ampulex compressa]
MKRSEALNETLAYVESAAGKTKNLQHCYDKGHKAFEVLKYRALLVYYECEDVGFMQFTAPNPDLEKIAEQGKKAIENLRKAIPPLSTLKS